MENITTDRLLIRAFQPDDWKDLYDYLSDDEVVRYEPYEVYTEEQSKEEAIRRASDEAFLAVCLKYTILKEEWNCSLIDPNSILF